MIEKFKNSSLTKFKYDKLYLFLIIYFVFKTAIAYTFDFSLGISSYSNFN